MYPGGVTDTTIIVLTCYEEFDYAKTALKLGAFDYILKPMDLDDFDTVLTRVQERYRARRKERMTLSKTLAELVHGREPRTTSACRSWTGMPFMAACCCVCWALNTRKVPFPHRRYRTI